MDSPVLNDLATEPSSRSGSCPANWLHWGAVLIMSLRSHSTVTSVGTTAKLSAFISVLVSLVATVPACSTGHYDAFGCTSTYQGLYTSSSSGSPWDMRLHLNSACSSEIADGYDGTAHGDLFLCLSRIDSSAALVGAWIFAYPYGESPTAQNVGTAAVGSLLDGLGSSNMRIPGCNGVSHAQFGNKTGMVIRWSPPGTGSGDITFRMHVQNSATSYYTIEKTVHEKYLPVSGETLYNAAIDASTNWIIATFSCNVVSAEGGPISAAAFSVTSKGGKATVTGISSVVRAGSKRAWIIKPAISGAPVGTEIVSVTLASKVSVKDSSGFFLAPPAPALIVTLSAAASSPISSINSSVRCPRTLQAPGLAQPLVKVTAQHAITGTTGGFGYEPSSGSRFGSSLAKLGDLDGDGAADLAVGAELASDGGEQAGAVWVMLLRSNGTVKRHWKLSGTEVGFPGQLVQGDLFGNAVATLGDATGDKVVTVAVGAPKSKNAGAAWILQFDLVAPIPSPSTSLAPNVSPTLSIGPTSSPSPTASQSVTPSSTPNPTTTSNPFSRRRSLINAVHLEERWQPCDVLRPALRICSNRNLNALGGADFVLQVTSHSDVSATDERFERELGATTMFGSSFAQLGDLDGDGVADLAVGAPMDDDGVRAAGAVWILFLHSNGTVKVHYKISMLQGLFDGDLDQNGNFGFSLAQLGDLDGDGVVDLAAGAPNDDDGAFDAGAVWILFLRSNGTVKGYQKISNRAGGLSGTFGFNDRFGRSLAVLGDLDGDGVVDLAAGAPRDDDGAFDAGAVWIIFLRSNGMVKAHQKVSNDEGGLDSVLDESSLFGTSLATLADVSSGGVTNLAVGSPGRDATWILQLEYIEPIPSTSPSPSPLVSPSPSPGSNVPGGFGEDVQVWVLEPVGDYSELRRRADDLGVHPSSLEASMLLNSPPNYEDVSFPLVQSALVSSVREETRFGIEVPVTPAEGETILVVCKAHSSYDREEVSGDSPALGVVPALQFVQRPAAALADLSKPKVNISIVRAMLDSSTMDNAPMGDGLRTVWIVCAMTSTAADEAATLALLSEEEGLDYEVSANSISELPGPAENAAYYRPVAVAIPARLYPVRWPKPADILTRLPDAVWGSAADGATSTSPAPGSAAAMLGRASRDISAWVGGSASTASDDPSADGAGRRFRGLHGRDLSNGTEEVSDEADDPVYKAMQIAKQAARSSGRSAVTAWVGPELVVSGSAVVTVACPLATGGASRVPCLPPSALVFVGGVQAEVLAASPQFDIAQVRLPSQQSVCGNAVGADSYGEDDEVSSLPDLRAGTCGPHAMLIAPPPLRASNGSVHPSIDWPPPLDWLQTNANGSTGSSLGRSNPSPSARRSLRSSTNISVVLDATTTRLAMELCSEEALLSYWRAQGGRVAAYGGEIQGCVIMAAAEQPYDHSAADTADAGYQRTYGGMSLPVAAVADQMDGSGGVVGLILRGGIEYVEQCMGYPEPGALCADRDAVRTGLVCAYGAGDECRPCPAGAACPGGFKAHPLPGYWSQEGSSELVLRCNAPAEARCLGWDAVLYASMCGEGYRQGSTGCSRCQEGRFPQKDGTCKLCPSSPPMWLLLQPVVLYGGGVLFAGSLLLLAVCLVAYWRGISLSLAAKRAVQFSLYTAALLQTVAQAGRAVHPGLPEWYYTVVRMLDVFRFESSTLVHPDCITGTKLGQEMLLLVASVMLAIGGYITFWRTGLPSAKHAAAVSSSERGPGYDPGATGTEMRPGGGLQAPSDAVDSSHARSRRRSSAGVLIGALEISSSSATSPSPGSSVLQSADDETSKIGGVLTGDGSTSVAIVSRAMLTITALLYAVVCTTVVQVLDCRTPSVLASLADPQAVRELALPVAALGLNESEGLSAYNGSDPSGHSENPRNWTSSSFDDEQLVAQVLATYGHDQSLYSDGAMLLAYDPTVVCYRDAAHLGSMLLSLISTLVVIVGLPVFLLRVILPEIDKTVAASPASEWLSSAKHLFKKATREQARTKDDSSRLACTKCVCVRPKSSESPRPASRRGTTGPRVLDSPPDAAGKSESSRRARAQFLSLKQLRRKYEDEQMLLFKQILEDQEKIKTSGVDPAEKDYSATLASVASDLGVSAPTRMLRLGRRRSGAAVSESRKNSAAVGSAGAILPEGPGSTEAGSGARGSRTTSEDESRPARLNSASAPASATSQSMTLLSSRQAASEASGESAKDGLELALVRVSYQGVGRAAKAGRSSKSRRGGGPRRRAASRRWGASVSPAIALQLLETVRDRARILPQTHRLADFAAGDYRASKAWIRVVDWMVLFLIACFEPLEVPQEPIRVILGATMQMLVMVTAAAIFYNASPFLKEYVWKLAGKLGALLLTSLAVALNAVAALRQDAALQAQFGSQLDIAALGLTYMAGVGSIMCVSILFVMFWWSILYEDPEDPQVIRRKREKLRLKVLDLEASSESASAVYHKGLKASGFENPMLAGSQKTSMGGGSESGPARGSSASAVVPGFGYRRKHQRRALVLSDDVALTGGLVSEQAGNRYTGMIIGSGGMRRKTLERVNGAIGMCGSRMERRNESNRTSGIGLFRTRVQKKG